jgi:hypothetical protein
MILSLMIAEVTKPFKFGEWFKLFTGKMVQALHWDRGRPARNARWAKSFPERLYCRFALRAHCGRDARGPINKLLPDIDKAQYTSRFALACVLVRI